MNMDSELSTERSQLMADGTIKRVAAKTGKVGFLHLPNELRIVIYSLAIYDHDRGVVLLPRGLPRKIGQDADVDLPAHDGEEEWDPAAAWAQYAVCVGNGKNAGAGNWVDLNFDVADVSEAELSGEPTMLTDSLPADGEVSLGATHGSGDEESPRDDEVDAGRVEAETAAAEEVAQNEALFAEVDADMRCGGEDEHGTCHCNCHEDENSLSGEELRADLTVQPNARLVGCSYDTCYDGSCEHRNQVYEESGDSDEATSASGSESDDHCYSDTWSEAEDVFDPEDKLGVLYEADEPGILMACTEIRGQCRPIYYENNAFSWRFAWQLSGYHDRYYDYERSLHRFNQWINSTVGAHAKLIRSVSFEARHLVEEGFDFGADIDIDPKKRTFELDVTAGSSGENSARLIKSTIERDLVFLMWKTCKRSETTTRFTAADLHALGRAFLRGMSR